MGRDKPLIDWDKLENIEVDDNLGWDDLKPGYTRPEDQAGAGSIAGAIVVAALIIVGGWIGYQEYKEYAFKRDMEENLNAFMKGFNNAPMTRAKIPEREIDITSHMAPVHDAINKAYSPHEVRDRKRKAKIRQEFANLCKFWTDQEASETRAQRIDTYCQ